MTDVELEVTDSFERVYPVPVVDADWTDVLDRAGARNRRRTRPSPGWRVVALAAVILIGGLLVTPAFGIGSRLLDLVQGARQPETRTVAGVQFSFSAGESWAASPITKSGDGFREGRLGISKSILGPQGAEAIVFWTSFPEGYRSEPCAYLANRRIGRSTADLAAAVAKAPGTRLISGPSNVRIGGLPAKHVVLIVRKDLGCDPGYFFTWYSECWGPCWVETTVGDTIRVWIVNVGGTRLFFAAATTEQADARLKKEINEIVQSIGFG